MATKCLWSSEHQIVEPYWGPPYTDPPNPLLHKAFSGDIGFIQLVTTHMNAFITVGM